MKMVQESLLNGTNYDYADAYDKEFVSNRKDINSTTVGKLFFSSGPKWMEVLFKLRNRLVKLFGLKTSGTARDKDELLKKFKCKPGEQLGLFKVFEKNEREVVIGEDDKHLNFRVSLLLSEGIELKRILTITTTVKFNNRFGKIYFAVIKPFHKAVVKSMVNGIIVQLSSATEEKS
jgi:hypothetical protein